jgi:hypothetical protein
MKKLYLTLVASALAASPALAQSGHDMETEKAGVIAAAMDYMEGAVTVDAERVGRGIHAELNKVVISTLPNGRQILSTSRYTQLVETVRGLGDRMADVDKAVDVTVFDLGNDMASVRAVGQLWYDLLQVAKLNGEWKLVNVLWASNQTDDDQGDRTGTPADRAAVEQAALDYVEGMFSGDADRVTKALHPELNSVRLRQHRQTDRSFMSKTGVATLIEVAAGGFNNVEEGQQNIEIDVQDVSHGIAAVKVTSSRATEYLQIGNVNGEGKVLNVLMVPNA